MANINVDSQITAIINFFHSAGLIDGLNLSARQFIGFKLTAGLVEELPNDCPGDTLVLLAEADASGTLSHQVGRVLALRNALKHMMWRLLAYHDLHARLDYSSLVGRYFVNCVPEGVHMVQANRRYGANEGVHDISRIDPPTHTDFEHNHVTFIDLVVQKGHQSRNLKEGQRERKRHRCLRHAIKMRDDALFTDHLSVDSNSLSETTDVWRGEKSSFETGSLKGSGSLEAY